jgi:hypothetical protein
MNVHNTPVIFLKIGWMSYYDGRDGDVIRGSHSYIKETKTGHEDRNFLPIGGRCYGYAPHNLKDGPARINFEPHLVDAKHRLLGGGSDAHIDGVTVVWIAPAPKGGVFIVGWYRNARLYAQRQSYKKRQYYATAKASDCTLLLLAERTHRFSKPPHQGAVWYGGDAIAGALRFIDGKRSSKAAPVRTVIDTALRVEIERAAIKATTLAYESRGFIVKSVENEAKGWDLEANSPGETLKIEVKGTARADICVEMTPNEYSKRGSGAYRIAIVSSALTKPQLCIFQIGADSKTWRDESGKMRLRFQELVAARLTVE